jgi:hypothetical protein
MNLRDLFVLSSRNRPLERLTGRFVSKEWWTDTGLMTREDMLFWSKGGRLMEGEVRRKEEGEE